MSVQMRFPDGRLYSPSRDLAYCFHSLAARAIRGLDPDHREPWVKEYIANNSITDEQLCAAAQTYAKYINTTLFDPSYTDPFAALTAAGFFDLPQAVQILICAKLGQVVSSAFFVSARDVTADASKPPVDKSTMAKAVARFEAAVRMADKKAGT